MIVWITGAPGTGKRSLAAKLSRVMRRATVLDGDDVREWLTPDCGFSEPGRLAHARRVWRVAKLVSDVGGTAIVALVAQPPYVVDLLIHADSEPKTPLWSGTSYKPPIHPDVVVKT